jgi:hypothetical protein
MVALALVELQAKRGSVSDLAVQASRLRNRPAAHAASWLVAGAGRRRTRQVDRSPSRRQRLLADERAACRRPFEDVEDGRAGRIEGDADIRTAQRAVRDPRSIIPRRDAGIEPRQRFRRRVALRLERRGERSGPDSLCGSRIDQIAASSSRRAAAYRDHEPSSAAGSALTHRRGAAKYRDHQ